MFKPVKLSFEELSRKLAAYEKNTGIRRLCSMTVFPTAVWVMTATT
jgi:hypothetical protein